MNKIMLRNLLFVAGIGLLIFIWYKYRQPDFIGGDMAPDFSFTLEGGREQKLSDFKGKYVVLQFWGSWCGPCRQENPILVELYNKFHDKGLEMVSVAIESKAEDWQRAIRQDGLNWPYHIMESQDFGGPISSMYNIRYIPSVFLIGPDGKIIGHNLSEAHVDRLLRDKLNPQ